MANIPSASNKDLHFFADVCKNFDYAAQFTHHDAGLLDQIKSCNSVYRFRFPIRKGNGFEVIDALRVEHSHVVICDSQIKLDRRTQRDPTLRGERASADLALEAGYVEPVFGERERAVAVLQANGQIGRRQRGVNDIDGAGDVWAVRSAVRVDIEFDLTGGAQIRIEELRKMQID